VESKQRHEYARHARTCNHINPLSLAKLLRLVENCHVTAMGGVETAAQDDDGALAAGEGGGLKAVGAQLEQVLLIRLQLDVEGTLVELRGTTAKVGSIATTTTITTTTTTTTMVGSIVAAHTVGAVVQGRC
jgi:hypothetical protein